MNDMTRILPIPDELRQRFSDRDPAVHGPAGVIVHRMLISGEEVWENEALRMIEEVIIHEKAIPWLSRKYHLHVLAFADDVAEESLIKVWKGRLRFDPSRATLHTWVTTITVRVMCDHLRKREPAQAIPDDHPGVSIEDDEDTVPNIEAERLREVLEAHFTPLERELLIFFAEYTGENWTAAAIEWFQIKTTPGALRVRVSRLRKKLLGLL